MTFISLSSNSDSGLIFQDAVAQRLWHRCFPANFDKISKNAFSYGTHLVAASGCPSIYRLLQASLFNFKAFSEVAISITFWLLTIWIKKVRLGKDQNLLMNLKAIARRCFQINCLFKNFEKFKVKHLHQRLLFINCRLILQLY